MTASFTRRFVDSLDTATSQRDGLADAIEALQAERASEFSRCLNGLCIDVVDSLRAVEIPDWKIVSDDQLPFSEAVLSRCRQYTNAEQEPEFSSALLAQVLFRANSHSLTALAVLRSRSGR
jgi:hypothetical protein